MNKPHLLFFDSNVYINVLRDPEYLRKVEPLLQGGFLFVINKIVLMELWAGVGNKREEDILRKHQTSFPLIGMRDDQFIRTGETLGEMRKKSSLDSKTRRSLTWDILISLSAVENNAIIVTENAKDFSRIQKYISFEFIQV